ncbi:MFS transporter [Paenibacillus sp. WLX1005]|uniref:MFS transporter n=1 Tax=Paenibacillus sp. WLX1005 TaxID=3243766 RepID=UPI0039840F7D
MSSIFRNWNFNLLLSGRFLANMGDSFYAIAAMWMVYQLGGSTLYTGLALFLTSLPALAQIVLGPLIDRFPAKRLMIFTQLTQALLLLIIPALYAYQLLTIAVVLTLMPIISLLNQFIYPTQLSLLPKVLPKEQLTRGNSLFAIAYQGSDAAFNSLAGIVIAMIGAVSVFYLNSMTFVLTALLFTLLRLPQAEQKQKAQQAENHEDALAAPENEQTVAERPTLKTVFRQYMSDLREGLDVLKKPVFTRMLLGIIFVNLAGVSIYAVLPAFGESWGGPQYYGFFMAAAGVGIVTGSYAASMLKLYRFKMGLLYCLLIFICGLCWMFTGLVPSAWMAIALFAIGWIPAGMINVLSQVMIQSIVPPQLIGRVMAAVIGLSAAIAPLGAILGGALGAWAGNSVLIISCGVIVVLNSAYWLLNKHTRAMPPAKDMTPAVLGLAE